MGGTIYTPETAENLAEDARRRYPESSTDWQGLLSRWFTGRILVVREGEPLVLPTRRGTTGGPLGVTSLGRWSGGNVLDRQAVQAKSLLADGRACTGGDRPRPLPRLVAEKMGSVSTWTGKPTSRSTGTTGRHLCRSRLPRARSNSGYRRMSGTSPARRNGEADIVHPRSSAGGH